MDIPIGEKFLPLGTIVLLKGGTKRIMICGYCVSSKEIQNQIFDYCGCLYPEGFLSADKTLLFNHDQISKVYYLGYQDEEENVFQNKLKDIVSMIKS